MMDFSGSAGAATPFDTMPNGQLAWAIINFRGLKGSASGGAYLDLELTLDDGQPYARKKLWDMIGDPNHAGNSEKYRQMGTIAITRILECGRNAGPNNLPGYQIKSYEELNGLRVAIKIGIEKGTDGHDDKNRVAEYLTPNPASASGHKHMQLLMAGTFNANGNAGAVTQAASGFGGAGAAAAAKPAASGFAGFGAGGTPAAASGFQAAAQAAAEPAQNAGSHSDSTGSAPAATSSSNPAAAGSWLQQANQ